MRLYGALRRLLIEAHGRPRVDGHIVMLFGAHPSKLQGARPTDVFQELLSLLL